MEPLSLRGHHINSAKLLFQQSEEEIIEAMKRFKYIKSSSDPFINIVYTHLKEYFQVLSNKLRFTIGGLDIICESCAKNQEGVCKSNNLWGYNVFLSGNSSREAADLQVLDKYGLKAEKIYPVSEVRKVAKF